MTDQPLREAYIPLLCGSWDLTSVQDDLRHLRATAEQTGQTTWQTIVDATLLGCQDKPTEALALLAPLLEAEPDRPELLLLLLLQARVLIWVKRDPMLAVEIAKRVRTTLEPATDLLGQQMTGRALLVRGTALGELNRRPWWMRLFRR